MHKDKNRYNFVIGLLFFYDKSIGERPGMRLTACCCASISAWTDVRIGPTSLAFNSRHMSSNAGLRALLESDAPESDDAELDKIIMVRAAERTSYKLIQLVNRNEMLLINLRYTSFNFSISCFTAFDFGFANTVSFKAGTIISRRFKMAEGDKSDNL
jgi:hypothetical protein